MRNSRLIIGDASQVLDRLIDEDVEVDCVFTSPNPFFFNHKNEQEAKYKDIPNNVGSEHVLGDYVTHLCVIFDKVKTILSPTGSLWVHMQDAYLLNGSMLQIPERFSHDMTYVHRWLLRGKRIWARTAEMSHHKDRLFVWDWEPIYWFTKSENYTWNNDSIYADTSIVDAPYIEGEGFPQQPIIEALDTTTKEGDIVLDPFMGTGPTGVVTKDMGRQFIGIDIVAEKVNAARKRPT